VVGAVGGHLDFSRMNIGPTILGNQIEDRIEILELVPCSGVLAAVGALRWPTAADVPVAPRVERR
jgi:hypothetical protein